MYTDAFTVKDTRCFADQKMVFNWPGQTPPKGEATKRLPNVNLLIGNNGTGKTTIFQALTIAALGPYLANNISGFRTPTGIRYGKEVAEASAKLYLAPIDTDENSVPDTENIHIAGHSVTSIIKREGTAQSLSSRSRAERWKKSLFYEDLPACFLAAYGANHRTERPEAYNERLRGSRYQRIASLFEARVGLIPLSMAYNQCQERKRWSEVVEIVNQLLQHPVTLTTDHMDGGEPLFNYDGIPLPLSELSDGYRLFVGWLIDFLTHLAQVLPNRLKLVEAIGMVIVDEVDLFLSPIWQRTVVESLSNVFPRIQWFCSTHSPLVAGSLDNDNIYQLKRSAPFTSQIQRPSDAFEGRSVEETLIELFDVHQPRSPQLQRQLSSLAERAVKGEPEASLEYLRRLNEGSGRLK